MRIKEFHIHKYGPLINSGRIALGSFSLLFGNNEEGKSLTIDAIVKMLFNRRADLKKFEKLERVEENPDGYIIIENDEDREIKLPESGDISSITNLSSSDCANLFIIRNSNLSISAEPEAEFYKNVTDRLTGLRTEEISKIKRKLQDFGKLTHPESTSSLSDKENYGKIASRCREAVALIEEIEELKEEMKEKGFDAMEEKISGLEESLENIADRLNQMEHAGKHQRYEETSRAMENLKKAVERVKTLEPYNRDDEQKWRDAEKELIKLKEQKTELLHEITEKEKEISEKAEKEKKLKRHFRLLEERKKEIDTEVRVDLKAHEKSRQTVASKQAMQKNLRLPTYAATLLLPVFVISLIFTSAVILTILTGLFAIVALAMWGLRLYFARKEGLVNSEFERIKLNVSKFGFEIERIEDLARCIQRFEDEYESRNSEINDASNEIEILRKELKKAREKGLPDIDEKIKSSENLINKIKDGSGCRSLEEYRVNLKSRLESEKQRDEQIAILKTHFGEQHKSLEQNVKKWEQEIQGLEEFKDKGKGIKYYESLVKELKTQKEEKEENKKKLVAETEDFRKQLYDIESRANKILQIVDERLLCSTSVDLEAIRKALESFVSSTNENTTRVKNVLKIFEDIEQEEEEKVQTLFGRESPVSKYFKDITGERYTQVDFIPDQGKILVKKNDGKTLDVSKLSGGSYDQLYFSIRLALGDKLLDGQKGFFIMDDPFIKADKTRLKRQIKLLEKIRDMGWQILYFSAKDEIKECLDNEIKNGNVSYIEIKNLC